MKQSLLDSLETLQDCQSSITATHSIILIYSYIYNFHVEITYIERRILSEVQYEIYI